MHDVLYAEGRQTLCRYAFACQAYSLFRLEHLPFVMH